MTEQNREELKRQLAETRAQMERLEAELERTEEWEPEGGNFIITQSGNVHSHSSSGAMSRFGMMRPTRHQAERARDLMRVHNRALAYVQEHAPNWSEGESWSVYQKDDGEWSTLREGCNPPVGAVVGPREVMRQLIKDLNKGTVKL